MSLFDNLFGSGANTDPSANPYAGGMTVPKAAEFLLGGYDALDRDRRLQQGAQAWQAQHDYATGQGQFAPPQQGMSGPLSITDGTMARGPTPPTVPGADYTSSPGPMDRIASAAQFGTPVNPAAPALGARGGTSLMDMGPRPTVPSYDDLGLPRSRQQTAQDALRLAAAGADPSIATTAYDWADPASKFDATPMYQQGQNGEWYRIQNGQFTQVKAPDQRFVQYTDAMGYPHMGWIAPPATSGAPSGPPTIGGSQPQPTSTPSQVQPPALSNNEAIQALQVAIAEDPRNPQGILSTIINRAAASGKSINEILQEPRQFETVSNGRAAKVPQAQAIQLYQRPDIQSIFAGSIPAQYAGVTQFYAPGAQRALGRPAPKWDDGTGFDVGQTRFFARPFEGNAVPGRMPMASSAHGPSSGPPTLPSGNGDGFQEISLPGSGSAGGRLDPQTQSLVDAIGQGRMAPLTLSGKSPRNAAIMAAVQEQYPNYDADAWKMRQDTTKNFFGGGKAGNQLGGLNTAIEHLGKLADSIDTIGNSDMPAPLNAFGNAVSNSLAFGQTAQKRVGQYNALDFNIKSAVQEALNAYKVAGGSEGEFNGLLKDFDLNGSRASQYQVLGKVLDLLDGKRQQLLQQYQEGMGGNIPAPDKLVDPRAQAVADRINAGAAGLTTGAPPGPPRRPDFATRTAPGSSGPPMKSDPFTVGQRYTDAKGNVATYRGNGQWQEG